MFKESKVGGYVDKFLELLFFKQIKGIGNAAVNKNYLGLIKEANGIDECIKMVLECPHKIDIELMMEAKNKALIIYKAITEQVDVSVLTVFDDEYPIRLNDLKNKRPPIIYAKGNIKILNDKSIAVVGTRTPSVWSQKIEEKLVKRIIQLSDKVIVSGLALGCDKIAHESTLEMKGRTVAVLPSGINVITPSAHKALATEILDYEGCIISEYEPDEKAKMSTYVARDGLIAALSNSTFVIECGIKSGTMHTVDAALKMNRNVACYYTNEEGKGDFTGNKHIIDYKGAEKVTRLEELKEYLIDVDDVKENNSQISFFE